MASENEELEISKEAVEDVPRPGPYIYIRYPESMENQILRNGFIPEKKSTDGGYSTGVRGSIAYRRE